MSSDIEHFRRIFRENLKQYREQKEITQIELSRKSNFDPSYLGKIERGDVDPSLESINRICEALDVRPRDLLLPPSGPSDASNPEELASDLEVHRIELEMQTEELRKREQQLTELKNRYQQLYDFSPVGFFTLDEEGVVRRCNRTFRSRLGLEQENPEGRHINEFLRQDQRDDFYRYRRKVHEGDIHESRVFVFIPRDGGTFAGAVEKVSLPEESLEDQTRFASVDVSRWVGEEQGDGKK